MQTVWVLGDQLSSQLAHLRDAAPTDTRVLLVISRTKLTGRAWHRQRAHLVLTAMHRFAAELREQGFEVDLREAASFTEAYDAHVADHSPGGVRAMEPMNRAGRRVLEGLGVELVRSDAFLTHPEEFAAWAQEHRRTDGSLLMEDFYRWQRRRLDVLLEADGSPLGGRWNHDHENRLPPPGPDHDWSPYLRDELDELDERVLRELEDDPGVELFGAPPDGTWPTSRAAALARLDHFVAHGLAGFGPYEDAVAADHWQLHHSLLSVPLNLGLLHPDEVVERVVEEYHHRDDVPLSSVEGFVRQVIGWREYVHGLYWLHEEGWKDANVLGATRPLPPVFTDAGVDTELRCLSTTLRWVDERAWTHHIPRLMVLANLATSAGIDPAALTDWMWRAFVDGAEWVMVPNVVGMGTFADGGRMSTKPYVSGGAYLNRMTEFCGDCRFDPRKRVGEDACPFTTLYWDFLARNEETLAGNHRLARNYATMRRLTDLDAVRDRAAEVLGALDAGEL